ncbi:ribonuclease D [Pseudonocardiaceae bacterium YIM PH 21723]|nr:ribonuclease D [Pseudonocardiaceae bacterium YIM PH 21723]
MSNSEATPLTEPAEGVPPVVGDPAGLARLISRLTAGSGAIAVDTERASGYRYSQRAYLIQLRREGSGSFLIDPIPLAGKIAPLAEAINSEPWVLHAASQDLPCLAELNLTPADLFDTELAGRLAGYPRVALGSLVEELLGYRLEKGHGAADWSRRPLPPDWLTYAALDVELLLPLRDVLSKELEKQGKLEWALEEFEAVRTAPPPAPRHEPWRRTSGIHRTRSPRQLGAVRALWEARDAIARERDIAPGRVLPDSAIINAATTAPTTAQALIALPVFGGRVQRKMVGTWLGALKTAAEMTNAELPDAMPSTGGPPPPNRWADKDPAAAARLAAARASLTAIAEQLTLPVENLLQPDLVRRTCWQPPAATDVDTITEVLSAGGARSWQIGLTAEALSKAMVARPS